MAQVFSSNGDLFCIFVPQTNKTLVMAELMLRSTKKQGTASLQVRVNAGGQRFWLDSHIVVDVEAYAKAMKTSSKRMAYYTSPEGERVVSLSVRFMDELKKALVEGITDPQELDERLQDIVFADTRKALREAEERRKAEELKKQQSILGYFDDFYNRMQDGTLLHHNGDVYKDGTIQIWRKFERYLREYLHNDYEILFDNINPVFGDGFTAFLRKKQFLPKTINTHRTCFRKLCRRAAQEGVNKNGVSLAIWQETTVNQNEKKAELYLTDNELDELYKMPLMGEYAEIRDIFLLGCFSCQRVSDYASLTKSNFITDKETGLQMFAITQRKTGAYVEIPITDERVTAICERYGYKFPKVEKYKINRDIKIILKSLSKKVPSLAEPTVTLLTYAERKAAEDFRDYTQRAKKKGTKALDPRERNIYYKLRKKAFDADKGELFQRDNAGQVLRPKYELISSHSARRSGVTNLYKTGLLDTREMMSISGHQSEKNFSLYIKLGTREQANRVAEKLRQKTKTEKEKQRMQAK